MDVDVYPSGTVLPAGKLRRKVIELVLLHPFITVGTVAAVTFGTAYLIFKRITR